MEADARPAAAPRWSRRLGIALAAAFAVGGVAYLVSRADTLSTLVSVRPGLFVAVAATEIALMFLRGVLLRRLLAPLGVSLPHLDATVLFAWSNLANYVAPGLGGAGVRAGYLKTRHGLPIASFASVFAASYVLQYLTAALMGLAAALALGAGGLDHRAAVAAGFACAALGCALLLVWPYPVPEGESRLRTILRLTASGWHSIRGARLPPLVLVCAAYVATSALVIGLAFASLGLELSPWQAILLAALAEFSLLVSITPAAFGIMESAIALGAALLGAPVPAAVAAAGLRRLVSLLTAAGLAAAGAGRVRRRA